MRAVQVMLTYLGVVAAENDAMLTEAGDGLLLESGDTILLDP